MSGGHVGSSTDQKRLLAGGPGQLPSVVTQAPDSSSSSAQCQRLLWGGRGGEPPESPGAVPLCPGTAIWAGLHTSILPANLVIQPAPGSSSHRLPQAVHVLITPKGDQLCENAALTTPGGGQVPSPRPRH